MSITKLTLIRHGESQWNKENRFTGWVDIDLSEQGYNEAKKAGNILKENGFIFDCSYTSVLKRAIHTLWIILDQLNQAWLPTVKSWRLNERHYGALQGLNKDEAIKKYGYETIQQWRRSFRSIPPSIKENNQFCGTNDIRYSSIHKSELPVSESLECATRRILPLWNNNIIPNIKNQKHIIIVAHGNSLRAIIKIIENLNFSEIFQVNIPTGIPLIYELNENIQSIKSYYLK